MTVKLNRGAVAQAERLIDHGKAVWDERDAWSEDQPTTRQQNAFIKTRGFTEYGKWHLGSRTARRLTQGSTTNSRMATSQTCIAAHCWPRSLAPASTTTQPSKGPPPASSPCSTRRSRLRRTAAKGGWGRASFFRLFTPERGPLSSPFFSRRSGAPYPPPQAGEGHGPSGSPSAGGTGGGGSTASWSG
jgi:hypothetical protein